MDALAILGSSLGLGFLSGIRLYATVLALGLAIRFNLFHLSKEMSALQALADTRVLIAAGAICAVEFLADKVPWIDSVWDTVHTVVRPIAATALAATALGDMDPFLKTLLALLSGSVALTAHSAKAATRLAVNHSPEPFSNIALSLAEDVAAPVGLWVVMQHPLWALGFVAVFTAAFALLAPRIWRMVRMEFRAIQGVLRSWSGERGPTPDTPDAAKSSDRARELWNAMLELGVGNDGLDCAATSSVKDLKRSVGMLRLGPDGLLFQTRRMYRDRSHVIPLAAIRGGRAKKGLFLNELVVHTPDGDVTFDVFKAPAAADAVAASLPTVA
jgi:hypothetical protein